MKTQHYAACSLDGFITDPDHSLGRHFQFGDTEGTGFPDFIRDVGAVAMGTSTYEWILRHQVHQENPQPWPYKLPE
jgi:dihydrofolate reductase